MNWLAFLCTCLDVVARVGFVVSVAMSNEGELCSLILESVFNPACISSWLYLVNAVRFSDVCEGPRITLIHWNRE
jgi:hypothetical protein